MTKLHKDILFLIFKELQDDSKSLFSCLLANRFCCETAIPILWRNPWRYEINYSNKHCLFVIFVLSLPDSIKEFLTRKGIKLSSISHQKLLFDYFSFCRSINVSIMNNIIATESSSDYDQFLLQQEFYNLLMRKCPEWKYLDMRLIKHQIFYFPEAKSRLESLCELKCDTSIDSSYFYGLACVCQNIQRLIIINSNTKLNHGTVKLIEVQRNLKYFKWQDSYDDEYFMELLEDPYTKIFLALENHADTLNHFVANIQFEYEHNFGYSYVFLQNILSKLHKLKALKFIFPPFSSKDHCEERLKTIAYRDLEIFKVDGINIQPITCIIKNSGGFLKKIFIDDYYIGDCDQFDNDCLDLIRIIYKNCPLIEYLSLPIISKEHFIEFEKLLTTCQKLRSLYFRDTYVYELCLDYEESLSDVLTRAAPANLRDIGFCHEIVFSLKTLEEFFEKWRGRPAITIFAYYHKYSGEDYVKLISKYKDDGVIKDFVTYPSLLH